MSARDDYPNLAYLHRHRIEAVAALDEIDRLRLDAAYMEDIARCRGEENERLRAWVFCPEHGPFCGGDVCCCVDKHQERLANNSVPSPSLPTHQLGGGGDAHDPPGS